MFTSPSRVFADIVATAPPTAPRVLLGRAVVLGASMAGLMAARVLSDHAEEVLVVDRDSFDGPPDALRPGVPQGSQVHALLPAGQEQFERWFPGFGEEAVAAGVVQPPVDSGVFFMNGVPRRSTPAADVRPGLCSTRPLLESVVRRRVSAIGNVRLARGRADGPLFDGDRVVGARWFPADGDGATEDSADLVVDATGRASRLGDQLAEHGWQRPPMRRMPIKLNYATALFSRAGQLGRLWSVVSHSVPRDGATARIAGIVPVEGDRWMVLVAGFGDDRPSRDPGDFLARCRRDFPEPFGVVADRCELLSEVSTYHQADSRRRDFHLLDRLPAGVIAAGDAVASFNPVYGQGMTSAALHAACLSSYLRSGPSPREPARAYFSRIGVVVDAAWRTSTLADLALPHVDGPYPRGYPLVKRISEAIFAASAVDGEVNHRLDRVTFMLAHPDTLLRPSTLLRVARSAVRPAPERVAAPGGRGARS